MLAVVVVKVLTAFQKILNPHQVYSLSDGGPFPGYVIIQINSRTIDNFHELLLLDYMYGIHH